MSKLTATQIKNAKPGEKPYKLSDGQGLYLLIHPNGGKYWRYDYRFATKRKTLSLGTYPEVSLKSARDKHFEARQEISSGSDPGRKRKLAKRSHLVASSNTFQAIAEEWFAARMLDKSPKHIQRTKRALEHDLYPFVGNLPLTDIEASDLLEALRKIEARGTVETAKRTKQTASQIFRYAIQTGRATRDPAQDLTGALKSVKKKHITAITNPTDAGKLMAAINGYTGTPVVVAALKISALLFQRPGEIRHMEWSEINWTDERWEIPAEKMKMKLPHIVPLSRQALAILNQLQPLTGTGKYVFPSQRGPSRPLSDNGVRTALRTLGYDNETMSPHGFRAMARTLLDEVLGYRVDWIEHQLAHAVKDPNGRAYNRTTHLEGRREMMQAWADYLDTIQPTPQAK
mgnify:CR=1 FL=1